MTVTCDCHYDIKESATMISYSGDKIYFSPFP
jgi:hypothetical protein